MRSFHSQGLWHVPAKPKDVLSGTLTYSPRDGLSLSVTGSFSEEFGRAPTSYPLIHGTVVDNPYGPLVTLVDCFPTQTRISVPGFASEQIRANRAYIGSLHLVAEDQSPFVAARVALTHLAEWSRLTGFTGILFERPTPDTISSQYRRPLPLEIGLEGENHLQIEVNPLVTQGGRRLEITEQVELAISGMRNSRPLEILRRIVSPLEDFLTFAAGAPSSVEEMVFIAESVDSPDRRNTVHLLYQPVSPLHEDRDVRQVTDMLFTWQDIHSSHLDLLQRWFRFRREFAGACDIFFGVQYAPPAYLETKILLLQTALGLLLTDRGHEEIGLQAVRSLKELPLTPRDHAWLSLLPSVNELALPWSAFAFIQDYPQLLRPLVGDDVEKFVTNLLTLRHQLFSFRDALERRRSLQVEYLRLIEQLNLLIKVRVFECLDFSRDEIAALISQNRRYLNLVSGHYLREESPQS